MSKSIAELADDRTDEDWNDVFRLETEGWPNIRAKEWHLYAHDLLAHVRELAAGLSDTARYIITKLWLTPVWVREAPVHRELLDARLFRSEPNASNDQRTPKGRVVARIIKEQRG